MAFRLPSGIFGLTIAAAVMGVALTLQVFVKGKRGRRDAEDDGDTDGSDLMRGMTEVQILELRRRHFPPNLSLSFSESPLCIVRGKGAYLYDHRGDRIIDCVNNVATVGHAHPRLAAVAARQLSLVNTNTRYLCPTRVSYVKKLISTFDKCRQLAEDPDALSVVLLVNSGSEANDLALRLARAYTGSQDVVVLGSAYHGHTAALIDISPYKYEGRGGYQPPNTTHKVSAPDTYRGPYGADDSYAGERYAQEVGEVCERLRGQGKRPAAFIAESILGCGGQLVLPQGYLQAAFAHVRRPGGLCISDEVQVGFGRVGEAFWAFETQGVCPDIVTVGKPAGNGYPLAAVITSPRIASAFAPMEYFNTFGGSNLACAIGEAVLDILAEEGLQVSGLCRPVEGLQENARVVGEYTKGLLSNLKERFNVVGDVRGLGLFIGVEMVEDRTSKEPSEQLAKEVVLKARARGVQISTDGPYNNVLKIKPPLCFSKADARLLFDALEDSLA